MDSSISWQTPEYAHSHKSADWYWAVSIIAVSAAAAVTIFNNLLLAVLIVVGAVALMLFASRPPEIIDVIIDDTGVIVGKLRYPYANLESFWVNEEHRAPKLLITSKKAFAPHIVLTLEETDPQAVRGFLQKHVTEEEQHESLIQLIMEYFRDS